MSGVTRRRLIRGAVAGAAGLGGLAAAERLARSHGLIPPDGGGVWGPGATLTYAAQRLLTRHSLAREFGRGEISKAPFANGKPLEDDEYKRQQAAGFAGWRLKVEGMVARPASFSVEDLKRLPARSQITHLACEEGWSFIAEWTGAPLAQVLEAAGAAPEAKFVVYHSHEPGWWDSVDMTDALHPQTLVTYGMNGGELPPGHGGPLRLRVPRQLGYKSVKYITRLTVTDNLKSIGNGLGGASPEFGYAWYAGI